MLHGSFTPSVYENSMLRLTMFAANEYRIERWKHDPIARPYWRVYWNRDPGWEVRLDGRAIALTPDRVLVVAPETVYTTTWSGPARHVYLHFTVDGLPGIPGTGIHVLPYDGVFAGLLGHLTAPGAGPLHAEALAVHALARLPASAFRPSTVSGPIAAAQALALRFLHRQVANAELARAADMHVNAFIRRFRAETGTTPKRWHVQQRLDAACLALEEGMEIEVAAERFGFCDRHHFSRAFARARGLPPAAYRDSAVRTEASSDRGSTTSTAHTR